MPTIEKLNPTFNDVTPFQGLTLFNEAIGDAGAGEEMPDPLTWNTASPVGEIDWSAVTVAVDAAGINRSNRAGAVLISPSYCLYAAHAPGNNTGHTWMTPGGVEVTRTFTSTQSLDTDLMLAKLSAPINNIAPMPILTNSSRAAGRLCLCIEMDRHLNAYRAPQSLPNSRNSVEFVQSPGTDFLESGDSGKPIVILMDGTAVMVGTPLSTSDTDDWDYLAYAYNASHYIDEINAILAADGEELTLWDLISQPAANIRPLAAPSFAPTRMPIQFMGV